MKDLFFGPFGPMFIAAIVLSYLANFQCLKWCKTNYKFTRYHDEDLFAIQVCYVFSLILSPITLPITLMAYACNEVIPRK